MSILLIYPPTAKICEPPAGIARLAGSLRDHDISCYTWDLNLTCLLDLFSDDIPATDTWSRRAVKNRFRNLDELRHETIYRHRDRYQRAVKDINRVLSQFGSSWDREISLANYNDPHRSPLKSSNLIEAAENYRKNPFYPCFSHRLDALMKEHDFDTIGISISYLSQALTAFALLGHIRQVYPHVRTIVGGGLITSWMSSPDWQNRFSDYIDHCIRGPAERELALLMGAEPEPGLVVGTPDYQDFDFSDYLAPGPILPYAASDGCYWKKCTFCPDRAEQNCFMQNSPDRVRGEIADLVSLHSPTLLHLLDNAISPAILRELVENPPGVAWYGFVRFERELEDPGFCHGLRTSGCTMLKIGLESGSQPVLDKMNKGIELTRAARVLTNLKAAGIATYVYLLFGTPHETEREARLTMEFVREHHLSITFLNLAIFNMPVCSPEAASIPDRFSDGDLSLYCDFIHPDGWDRKSVRQFLQNRFKKDPVISRIIQRDPPFFTSNHAPLLFMNEKSSGR